MLRPETRTNYFCTWKYKESFSAISGQICELIRNLSAPRLSCTNRRTEMATMKKFIHNLVSKGVSGLPRWSGLPRLPLPTGSFASISAAVFKLSRKFGRGRQNLPSQLSTGYQLMRLCGRNTPGPSPLLYSASNYLYSIKSWKWK